MPGNHQHAVVWQAVANFAQARSEARKTAQDLKEVRREQEKLNATTAASAKTDRDLLTRMDQIAKSRRTLTQNSKDLTRASSELKRALEGNTSAQRQSELAALAHERALARLYQAQARSEAASYKAAQAARVHATAVKAEGEESDRAQAALSKLNVLRTRETAALHTVQAAHIDVEKSAHRLDAAETALALAVTRRSAATASATSQLGRLGAAGGGALGTIFRLIGGFAGFGKAAEGAAGGVGKTVLMVSSLVFGLAPLIPVLINASAGFLSLASALAPVVASIGAIPGLAAGAAQGILTLVAGFRGIGGTLKAGFQAFGRDGKPTPQSNSVQDRAAQQAHAVKQATNSLADAQYNAVQAQKALDDARKTAADNINRLKDAVVNAALAERGASLGLEEAQRNLEKLQATPGATRLQLEQAKLQVDQARQGLKEAKKNNADTQQQETEAAKKGVENSDVVQNALRAQMLSARALGEAQYQLAKAQKDAANSAAAASDPMSKYQQQLKDLTPAGQAFVKQLMSMRASWKDTTDATQEAMLPGFTSFLKDVSKLMPTVKSGLVDMGGEFSDFASRTGKRMSSPEWIRDLKTIGGTNSDVLHNLLGGLDHALEIFRKMAVVTAPLQKFMARGIKNWLGNIDKGMNMDRLAKFFGDGGTVQTAMHNTGQILKNIWGTVRNIGQAASGSGQDLLSSIVDITARWKEWTGSVEGQNRLSRYFAKARETLRVFTKSLGDSLRALGRWTEMSDSAGNWKKFTDAIRPFLQAIGKLITGDAGQHFFDALTGLLQNIGDVAEVTGALGTFVGVLEKLTGALSWFLHVPLLGKTIGVIVTALAGFKALKFASQITGLTGLTKSIGDFVAGTKGTERLNDAGQQTMANKLGGKVNERRGGTGVTPSSTADPSATLQEGASKASATLQEGASKAATTLQEAATKAAGTQTTAASESAATTKTAASEAGATAKVSATEAGATAKLSATEAAATEKLGASEAAASIKLGASEAGAIEKESAAIAGGELKSAAAIAGGELKSAAAIAGGELRAGALGGAGGGFLGGGGKAAKGGKLGGLMGGMSMGGMLGGIGAEMLGGALQDGTGGTKDAVGKLLSGAGSGAALGSFLGPVGTAAGAVLGGIAGVGPELWKDAQSGIMPWTSQARKDASTFDDKKTANAFMQAILADGSTLGPATAAAAMQMLSAYPELLTTIALSGATPADIVTAMASGKNSLGSPAVKKFTNALKKPDGSWANEDASWVSSLLVSIFLAFRQGAHMMGIKGFKDGGLVTGSGGKRSDSVPIKASPGEFIVNANASQRYRQLLEAINTGQDISAALIDPSLPGSIDRFWTASVYPELAKVPGKVGDALAPASDTMGAPFQTAWDFVSKNAVPGIQRALTGLVRTVGLTFGPGWTKLSDILSGPFKTAADNIHDVQWPSIKGDFTTASEFVQTKFSEAWEKASEFLGVDPVKKATGSWVPGAGNTDSVNARLTPGEYVIRKDAAAMIERSKPGLLDSLNWIDRGRASKNGDGFFWGEEVLSDIVSGASPTGKGGAWTKALLGGVAGTKKELADRANGHVMGVPEAGLGAQGVAAGYLMALRDKLKDNPAFAVGMGSYNPSAGVAQWTPTIMRVLRELIPAPAGADAGSFYAKKAAIVQMMIQHESGGNPKAINLWDINAQNGHPSQGLMQCVTLDTKILTKRGWLTHDEVLIGDETIGYNPETGRSEWTPISAVVHYEDAPIWRIGHKGWHADVTPNHRWFSDTEHEVVVGRGLVCPECSREFKTERGMETHLGKVHRVSLTKTVEYRGEFIRTYEFGSHHRLRLSAVADTDGIPGLSLDDVQILAWLQGDGHLRPVEKQVLPKVCPECGYISLAGTQGVAVHRGQAHGTRERHKEFIGWDGTIYQSKPEMVTKLRALLAHVEYTEDVREARTDKQMPQHVFRLRREYVTDLMKRSQVLEMGPEAFVLALSPDQRAAWLSAMIDAEGHRQPGKKAGYSEFVRIAQVNGPLQDAIRLAVYLEGWRPTYSANSAEKNGFKPAGLVGMAKPHVAPSTFHAPIELENQTVWCVKTDLETWTAELDGQFFLTGNTIPGTFRAHAGPYVDRGITDPLANIYAGVHYALGRYGSLENVPGVRGVRNGTGYVGYKSGGWFPIQDVGAAGYNFGGTVPAYADGGSFTADNSHNYNGGSMTFGDVIIKNPVRERATDSLPRVIRKMTKVGVGR